MPFDHYIAQVQTKPWVVGGGQFWIFDDATGKLEKVEARTAFGLQGLNSPELEKWFGKEIESPLGQYLNKFRENSARGAPAGKKEDRALKLCFHLSTQRIVEATEASHDYTISLQELMEDKTGLAEGLLAFGEESFEFAIMKCRDQLFFPENGFFPVACVGEVALAMPLSLTSALLGVRRRATPFDFAQLRGQWSYWSIGVGGSRSRIVVPPGWHPAIEDDQAHVESEIVQHRADLRRQFELLQSASGLAGLPRFELL